MNNAASGIARRVGAGALYRLSDLLFPPACAFCHGELETEAERLLLCARCVHTLAPLGVARCPRCGLRIPAGLTVGGNCEACRPHRQSFEAVWALGDYGDLLCAAVLRAKRPAGQVLARALARLAIERHGDALRNWAPDLVVPAPMHWLRRAWRGANSPETTAELAAGALSAAEAGVGLRRRRLTRPQANLPARQRRANVRKAFRVTGNCDFQGARVLLVDDILTTGATLGEMGRIVREAGAAAVAALVLARAASPG